LFCHQLFSSAGEKKAPKVLNHRVKLHFHERADQSGEERKKLRGAFARRRGEDEVNKGKFAKKISMSSASPHKILMAVWYAASYLCRKRERERAESEEYRQSD
jgi:hypothetical protein